jgi:hypothetical protein
MKCELTKEPEDDAYKLGKTIAEGGEDPAGNPLAPENIEEIDLGQIIADAAGQRSLSSSCIPPQTFSVMGHSYTLDTTLLCQFAEIVGYMMVAASSIIAVRMVTSGGS